MNTPYPDYSMSVLFTFLLGILLAGCQSLPDYFTDNKADIPHDAVATHEYILGENSQDLVGIVASIQTTEKDTLPDIARHFGLGYNDITIANPHLDPWLPEPGSQVILPLLYILPDAPRRDIVLNLASMRLFYFPRQLPDRVVTYPVGIGRKGWNTPTGLTRIIAKKKNPAWHVPTSILKEHAKKGDPLPRVVLAGPDNPLGEYAMRLEIPSYLIHGTNKPYGVGMQISHGCVRLYPEDIASLFQQTAIGTGVSIVNQPYLLGWNEKMLFLEAHDPIHGQQKTAKKKLLKKLTRIAREQQVVIDWAKVENMVNQANGIPAPILKNSAATVKVVSLSHPGRFNRQPIVEPLTHQDWSITVAKFEHQEAAQKLAALLNHQGPQIPARWIQKDHLFHVIAGPYENEKETLAVAAKIQRELDYNAKVNTPRTAALSDQNQGSWLFSFN